MNIVILILLAAVAYTVVAWSSSRFARLIDNDGYGHRPPPRSHEGETARPR